MTGWARFAVEALALEPVAMSSGERGRNRVASLRFLTGSALRGALARRWLRQHGYPTRGEPTALATEHRDAFVRAFESGLIRFPFLFPEPPPPPLSARRCKADSDGHRGSWVDLAAAWRPTSGEDRDGQPRACPECHAPLDRPRDGRAGVTVRTRTAVGNEGVAAQAMLYSQEELPEGQRFHGVLRVHPDLAGELERWLPVGVPVRVAVGADRSTGGLVEVRIARDAPAAKSVGERQAAWPCPGVVALSARSPLVLTDRWLRPARRFDPGVLAELLGVEAVEVCASYHRGTAAGGWNPGAGLPKPADVALAEGSVAVLRTSGDLDLDRLARLEDEGVGWRRAEGYGEVVFWDPRHLEFGAGEAPAPEPSRVAVRAANLSAPAWSSAALGEARFREEVDAAVASLRPGDAREAFRSHPSRLERAFRTALAARRAGDVALVEQMLAWAGGAAAPAGPEAGEAGGAEADRVRGAGVPAAAGNGAARWTADQVEVLRSAWEQARPGREPGVALAAYAAWLRQVRQAVRAAGGRED